MLKYTAYAAMINKTAVCQGYASLLYRLLLECGVDCRVVTGYGNGGRHAWNIVEVDGKYYNVAGTSGYRWLESELVRGTNEEFIDRSYYHALVNAAVETISQYGDFEWFVSND